MACSHGVKAIEAALDGVKVKAPTAPGGSATRTSGEKVGRCRGRRIDDGDDPTDRRAESSQSS